jgi:hypothetical protein
MNKPMAKYCSPLLIGALILLVLPYNNCSSGVDFKRKTESKGTEWGNPITDSTAKVVGAVCEVISRCHAGVSVSSCETGVMATDGIDASLGLPTAAYDSGDEVANAEEAGQLFGSTPATTACTSGIQALSCSDSSVQAAYDSSATNPYANVPGMIPTTASSCPSVFLSSTYYFSPSGSDTNAGTTEASPWLTFGKLFNATRVIKPGDTVILLDGTYTKSTTGFPQINCSTNANSGSTASPITLRAKNERQAFLKSDGSANAFIIEGCAHWNIEGLRTETADLSASQGGGQYGNVIVSQSSNISLRRMLAANTNRYFNTHVYVIGESQNVLIEESEAYGFHRSAFHGWRAKNITIRRSYANGRGRGQMTASCGSNGNVPYCTDVGVGVSDSGFNLGGTSDSIVENSITEHLTGGFVASGGTVFDGQPGGHNNMFLGSISLNDAKSAEIWTDNGGPVVNNLYKDFVAYGASKGASLLFHSPVGLGIENVTILGSTYDGMQAHQTVSCTGLGGCGVRVLNSLSSNNGWRGFLRETPVAWTVEYANGFNNAAGNYSVNSTNVTESISDSGGDVRNSLSVAPTGMGLGTGQCLLWVPSGSNMKGAGLGGADIGANILYRYENGRLTSQPLWDRTTGEFPRGAIVAGVNDTPGDSPFDIHTRLNVNRNGCSFPAGY